MKGMKRSIAAGGLLLGMAGVAHAGASSAGSGDVAAELQALRARVAELETTKNSEWLNERRAEEVKSLVRDVLADADTRASLMADGVTAGHDGKSFFLSSADGNQLLRVGGQIQFRYVFNSRDNADGPIPPAVVPGTADDSEAGFELRRTKLTFSGHVGSPKIIYSVGLQADRNSETIFLDHAYVGYAIADGFMLYGGEDKAPFLREELTSSKRQLTVERSLMNEFFTAGRIQGVWLTHNCSDDLKVTLAITDGVGSGESGDAGGLAFATKNFAGDAADFAFTARADMRLSGEWAQKDDFSAWSGEGQAVFVGAAVHYEEGETGDDQSSTTADHFFAWTVDGSYEMDGLSLFAAIAGVHAESALSPVAVPVPGMDTDTLGVVLQGSYMLVADQVEPFVRYEYIDPDVDGAVNLVTAGTNYYLNGHNAKMTFDVVWALNSLDTIAGSTGLGLLPDSPGESDQFALRAQFQLLF